MKDIKISKDCYVPKANVKFYTGYSNNAVRVDVRKKRKEDKVFDYTYGKKVNSVIYLMSGELILVNTSVETLAQRMETETEEI